MIIIGVPCRISTVQTANSEGKLSFWTVDLYTAHGKIYSFKKTTGGKSNEKIVRTDSGCPDGSGLCRRRFCGAGADHGAELGGLREGDRGL